MHHHREPPSTTTKPTPAQPLSLLVSEPDPDPPLESKTNSYESLNYSPPGPETPTRNPDRDESSAGAGAGAIILAERYYSPLTSPAGSISPPKYPTVRDDFPPPKLSSLHAHPFITFKDDSPPPSPPPPPPPPPPPQPRSSSSMIRDHRKQESPPSRPPGRGVIYGGGGGERKMKEGTVKMKMGMGVVEKVGVGMRVLEIVFCLVSFSVMATDKTQGWSGDSFDRYKEYRFCFTVNIIGFAYAGVQALKFACSLAGGNHNIVTHHLCYKLDFFVDQIIAYLLMAASTAGATRVADWEANWGKDEFTKKASMSVSMAFLAFIAFACSSLISGYSIFNSHH